MIQSWSKTGLRNVLGEIEEMQIALTGGQLDVPV